MIRYIVMSYIRGENAEEKTASIATLKRRLEALPGRIPGLLELEIGVDTSRVDYACDVVLYSEFESRVALSA